MEKDFNHFNCKENEYIIFENEAGEVIDKYKWNGKNYQAIQYKVIENSFSGKIKPRNIQQQLAFDMLQDEKTTVNILTGCFGSGKICPIMW